MLSSNTWRAIACTMAVMAVTLGLWSVYRDFCRERDGDRVYAAKVAALEDSVRASKVAAALATDAMLAANAERRVALTAYRAHQAEDAHRTASDSGQRDSLRAVVAGAVASAGDSVATIDSVRAALAVVVRTAEARGRVDSLAIVRLTGRLVEADGVIRRDSVALAQAFRAVEAGERRAVLAERLGEAFRGQRDAAERGRRGWKLGAIGAAAVAVLAALR